VKGKRSTGPVVNWSGEGKTVNWSGGGKTVNWSGGQLVRRSTGPAVNWSGSENSTGPVLFFCGSSSFVYVYYISAKIILN
jgi:hypothetical protein